LYTKADYNLNYHVSDDDFSYYGFNLKKFQETFSDKDFYVNFLEYSFEGSQVAVEDAVKAKLVGLGFDVKIEHFENSSLYLNAYKDAKQKLMILCRIGKRIRYEGNIFEEDSKASLYLRIAGGKEDVAAISELLKQPPVKSASMKWYFLNDGRMDNRTLDIKQQHPVKDEMYPWIEGGVQAYFKRYLESDANILILLGEPGTGKTTFIRELIVSNGLDAMITYEESLMNSDRLYIDLICNDDQDILILEDADTMLLSREADGNKVMSKLLNISDGLMKNKKKIVFTANLKYGSLSKTDHALVRPGRCFGVMDFRPLSYQEAQAAASAMGLEMPDINKSDVITLAQLTNPDYINPEVHKVGFV
jgi:hypothetical protein